MTNTAQKNISDAGSTQKFTEIKEISEDVVILNGSNACLIIEVQASNFSLLSKEEQDTKIFSYASLLNSISFPIQILIRNKKLDISSYIKLLETEIEKAAIPKENQDPAQAEKLSSYIRSYKDFVSELVKVNIVLDKEFYIVIPYSFLEKGIGATAQIAKGGKNNDFAANAKATLRTKAQSLLNQLARLNLRAKVIEKGELIKLFYSIFNEDFEETSEVEANLKTTVIKMQKTL